MGFMSGLLGGITLTSSVLYLTVALHQRNRLEQSLHLRQQALVLRNITDPLPPPPEPTAREAKVGVVESAKDKWNGEITDLMKRIQYTDWNDVRERLEYRLSNLWDKASEGIKEAGEAAKVQTKEVERQVASGSMRGREG